MERSARSEVSGLAKSSTPPTRSLVNRSYATHASHYQIMPIGVVAPRTIKQARIALAIGREGRRLHTARRRQLLCSRARAGQSCPQAVRIVRHRIAAPGHVLVGASERKIAVVEIARRFSTLWPSASTPQAASTASRSCPTAVNQRPPFEQGGGTCSARMAPPPLTTKHPLMRSRCMWLNRE